jgi:ketosteroid isomerase-like protein
MSALETVQAIYAAYGQGDVQGALDRCSENVRFRWPVDEGLSRLSGEREGKAAFLERLGELQATFEYHSFQPIALIADGDRVAAQIRMEMTHRRSGRRIVIENAHFWTVQDGRAIELVEYFDSAAVAASEAG